MRNCIHVLLFVILATPASAQGWPRWRGPHYNGKSPERLAPREGKIALPDRAWRRNVGEGCGSVVVSGRSVYTTGWRKGEETVWSLDADDGSVEWSKSYRCPRYGRYAVGDKGSYSGPTATPTLDPDSKLLYTLGGDGDLRCWDTAKQGAAVWAINLYDQYKAGRRPNVGGGQRDYGYTTAPLVHENNLLVAVGGKAGLLVASDKRTGKRRWASDNNDFASNCGGISPIRVNDIPCVAVLSLKRLVVIRTDRGHEGQTLAEYPWRTDYANNLVTPTVVGNRILLSSSYNIKKMVLLEIQGKRILKKWESRYYSGVCSPVVHDGRIYFAYQKLHCLNLANGALVWKGGRFGPDGSCLVTADGYVIAFGNRRLAVIDTAVRSPDAHRELTSRNGICRKDEAWPHVVLAGSQVYCKDKRGNLTCFKMKTRPNKKVEPTR
jgi:outer membrane protein assembly factor BamB